MLITKLDACKFLFLLDLRITWLPIDILRFISMSFGHQGALCYVFLASDPLKTSREYAMFTLHTRGLKVCTRETSRQTQRVSAFLFWLRQMIALITSYIAGQVSGQDKIS